MIIGSYVSDSEIDLCGICTEKFERFMDGEIGDTKPTEYEQYHSMKENARLREEIERLKVVEQAYEALKTAL